MTKEIVLASIEEAISKSEIVIFNDEMIEVPDTFILSKGKRNLLYRILNIDLEVIICSDEDFSGYMELVENLLSFNYLKSKTLIYPKSNVLLNTSRILEDAFFVVKEKNTIRINSYSFTKSKLEFYGFSLLTKRKVFFLDKQTFSNLVSAIDSQDEWI